MLKRVFLVLAMTVSGLVFQAPFAHANACGAAARQLVAGMPGATLLAVQARQGNNGRVVCVARIRVATGNGKPPRVIVRRFSP